MKFDACPVEPPGLGRGPLSSNTTSRQPSRVRWKARLLPTIPQPMTTHRAWAGSPPRSPPFMRRYPRQWMVGLLLPIYGEVSPSGDGGAAPHSWGGGGKRRRGRGCSIHGEASPSGDGWAAPPHSWGGGAKRRRGWGMAWDPWARSLRLVGRPRLLRQLVPADAVPDLRPQPPLERLRLVVDRLPELVEARVDQGAVAVERVER